MKLDTQKWNRNPKAEDEDGTAEIFVLLNFGRPGCRDRKRESGDANEGIGTSSFVPPKILGWT